MIRYNIILAIAYFLVPIASNADNTSTNDDELYSCAVTDFEMLPSLTKLSNYGCNVVNHASFGEANGSFEFFIDSSYVGTENDGQEIQISDDQFTRIETYNTFSPYYFKIENLSPGDYHVAAILGGDHIALQCDITIESLPEEVLLVDLNATGVSNTEQGSLAITIDGGDPPYLVEISGEGFIDTVFIESSYFVYSDLVGGDYVVSVSDITGLVLSQKVTIGVIISNENLICPGDCQEIGRAIDINYCHEWSPIDGLDDPQSPISMACPNISTIYTLRVFGFDGKTVEELIYAVDVKELELMPAVPVLCVGASLTIGVIGSYDTYSWKFGQNELGLGPEITVNEIGLYSITVVDQDGCTLTKELEVFAGDNPGSIKEKLLNEGFHIIHGGIDHVIPILSPPVSGFSSFLPEIFDYSTVNHLGIHEKLAGKVTELESLGYSAIGILTSDDNYCDGDFQIARDQFFNATQDFVLWYHITFNDLTNEYELLEKVNNYDQYLIASILPFVGDDLTPCDEPCKGTKRVGRCGNVFWYGTIEHWLIELDYIFNYNLSALAEYMIPYSGRRGGPGYVDIADPVTGELFEIKPNNETQIANGRREVENYVAQAILHCPFTAPWKKGFNYPSPRYLPNPRNPLVALKVILGEDGLVLYEDANIEDPLPEPVFIPQFAFERIRIFMASLKESIGSIDIELEVARFIHENPDTASYIAAAAVGSAIVIVVASIVADVFTGGVSIADDWATLYLAFRLVRIASII